MKVRCTQKKVFYVSKNKFTDIFIKKYHHGKAI